MRYSKVSNPIKPAKRSRLSISTFEGINTSLAEELIPFKYSPKSYNFKMSGGILQQGGGFSSIFDDLDIGTPLKTFEYRRYNKAEERRDDRIVIINTDNKVWQFNVKTQQCKLLDDITTKGKAVAVNYRFNGEDVLLLSSLEGGLYIINDDKVEKVVNSPNITSMCTHYDRVYCSVGGEKNAVWFSDDFDPTNWNISLDEGGYIELNDDLGEVIAVVSFADRVFIFREYGINRLAAYNEQTSFAVSRLYLSTGRILADTIAVCGSVILFQSDDTVYQFDGLDAKRIMNNLNGLFLDNEDSCAVFHNGSYYLSCRLDFGKEATNNSLIEYRLYDGDVSIMYGFFARHMSSSVALGNKLVAVVNDRLATLDNSGCLFDEPLKKLWSTPSSTLGLTDTVKMLNKILINTKSEVKVIAELDEEVYHYYLEGNSRYQEIKVNKRFDSLKLEVVSECATSRISRIELVIDMR